MRIWGFWVGRRGAIAKNPLQTKCRSCHNQKRQIRHGSTSGTYKLATLADSLCPEDRQQGVNMTDMFSSLRSCCGEVKGIAPLKSPSFCGGMRIGPKRRLSQRRNKAIRPALTNYREG